MGNQVATSFLGRPKVEGGGQFWRLELRLGPRSWVHLMLKVEANFEVANPVATSNCGQHITETHVPLCLSSPLIVYRFVLFFPFHPAPFSPPPLFFLSPLFIQLLCPFPLLLPLLFVLLYDKSLQSLTYNFPLLHLIVYPFPGRL
jgi:hypothetical protein